MLTRTIIGAGCLALGVGLSAVPVAAAAGHTQRIATRLTVRAQATPTCHAKICTIHNHGVGTMTGFGRVSFTTVITDDTTKSPCPGGSYVPQLRRTITTAKGDLVLNEAGLVCPQPKSGPRVDLVWVADGAQSTGLFAGARGTGIDHAYLERKTAVQTGTITLAG